MQRIVDRPDFGPEFSLGFFDRRAAWRRLVVYGSCSTSSCAHGTWLCIDYMLKPWCKIRVLPLVPMPVVASSSSLLLLRLDELLLKELTICPFWPYKFKDNSTSKFLYAQNLAKTVRTRLFYLKTLEDNCRLYVISNSRWPNYDLIKMWLLTASQGMPITTTKNNTYFSNPHTI